MNPIFGSVIADAIFFALIGGVLTGSIAVNLYFLLKKSAKDPKQEEDSDSSQRHNAIKSYLERQINETKMKLESDAQKRPVAALDRKVIALRTAYLHVEKKAYDTGESTIEYWDVVNTRLLKLLQVFMPKLFSQDKQIHELEGRITLLKERIQAMGKDKKSVAQNRSVKSLAQLLKKYQEQTQNQQAMTQHFSKLEKVVDNFSRPDYRKFYKELQHAKAFSGSSSESVDSLHALLHSQRNSLTHLQEGLSKVEGHAKDTELAGEYEALQKKLLDEKRENERLTLYVEQLKRQIVDFDTANMNCEEKVSVIIKDDTQSVDGISSVTEEMHELSSEIADISEQEITRLRDMLNRQRKSIMALDDTIDAMRDKLRMSEGLSEQKDAMMQELRVNAEEAEMCAKTLERQVDELRRQANDAKQKDDDIVDEEDWDALYGELQKVKLDLSDSHRTNTEKAMLLTYVNDALQADSLEDLAALLFHQLHEMHYEPSMEIRYQSKSVHISTAGKMKKQDRLMVENMKIDETNISAEGSSVKFRMLHILGIIRCANKDRKMDNKQPIKHVLELVQVTNQLIEKVGSTQLLKGQQKALNMCQNTIKKVAFDVDRSFGTQANRTKAVIESSAGQLQDLLKSSGIESAKIATIQNDALMDLEADDAIRLKTRKQFLSLIHQLETL